MSWTEERIERLKKMWADGATASEIADKLGGVSRNAVIGKAHRLGLEARPSPVKPGEEKAQPAAKPQGRRLKAGPRPRPSPLRSRPETGRPAAPAHPADAAPLGRRRAISLCRPGRLHSPGSRRPAGADPAGAAAPPGSGQAEPGSRRQDQPARLNDRICKWPMGHPGEPDFHFCGQPANPGYPYCVAHCGVAYQAQLPRRDRRPPPPLPFGGPRVR
jgi:GcrA cell cycle regulator